MVRERKTRFINKFRVTPTDEIMIYEASKRFESMSVFFVTLVKLYANDRFECPLVQKKDMSWEEIAKHSKMSK